MKNNNMIAMTPDAIKGLDETTEEIMSTKNGMTAEDMRAAIDDIYESSTVHWAPTSEEDYENLYTVDGSVAQIPIDGILTPKASPCAAFFAGSETEYGYISAAIEKAESDYIVDSVDFLINSPGGYVSGVDEVAGMVAKMKKPTRAIVGPMAASAAYWIASQADEIIATSRTSLVGSIGVAAKITDTSEADKKRGVTVYEFSSTNAPKKRPDITTDEGKKQIISSLDDIHAVFVKRVAEGRGVTEDEVNSLFGQGDVVIAEKALKAGMIDSIMDYQGKKLISALPEKNITEEADMDLKSYLEKNPEAKAEVDAFIEAKAKSSLESDRERVAKILSIAGSAVSENMKTAIVSGMSYGDFAIAELEAQREKMAKAGKQDFGTFGKTDQTPADSAPVPKSEKEKEVEAWDKAYEDLYGKKESK